MIALSKCTRQTKWILFCLLMDSTDIVSYRTYWEWKIKQEIHSKPKIFLKIFPKIFIASIRKSSSWYPFEAYLFECWRKSVTVSSVSILPLENHLPFPKRFIKCCKEVQSSNCQEFLETPEFLMIDPPFTPTGLFFFSPNRWQWWQWRRQCSWEWRNCQRNRSVMWITLMPEMLSDY